MNQTFRNSIFFNFFYSEGESELQTIRSRKTIAVQHKNSTAIDSDINAKSITSRKSCKVHSNNTVKSKADSNMQKRTQKKKPLKIDKCSIKWQTQLKYIEQYQSIPLQKRSSAYDWKRVLSSSKVEVMVDKTRHGT